MGPRTLPCVTLLVIYQFNYSKIFKINNVNASHYISNWLLLCMRCCVVSYPIIAVGTTDLIIAIYIYWLNICKYVVNALLNTQLLHGLRSKYMYSGRFLQHYINHIWLSVLVVVFQFIFFGWQCKHVARHFLVQSVCVHNTQLLNPWYFCYQHVMSSYVAGKKRLQEGSRIQLIMEVNQYLYMHIQHIQWVSCLC